MTFDEKMEFTEKMLKKIDDLRESAMIDRFSPENIKNMTAGQFLEAKATMEAELLIEDFMKGLAVDICKTRELVEENNKLLRELLNKMDKR